MPATQSLEPLQKLQRRRQISAFALNGLNENRGYFFGIDQSPEEFILDMGERARSSVLRSHAISAAIGVGIGRMENSGKQSAKMLPLDGFAGGQRQRTKSAAVKTSVKGDELVAFCVVTRQFHGRFNGFGAGIPEVNFFGSAAGSDRRQLFSQVHHSLVVKIRARHMNQFSSLLLYGCNYLRVAMSGSHDRYSRGKIQKGISILILDNRAATLFGDEGIVPR